MTMSPELSLPGTWEPQYVASLPDKCDLCGLPAGNAPFSRMCWGTQAARHLPREWRLLNRSSSVRSGYCDCTPMVSMAVPWHYSWVREAGSCPCGEFLPHGHCSKCKGLVLPRIELPPEAIRRAQELRRKDAEQRLAAATPGMTALQGLVKLLESGEFKLTGKEDV